MPLVISRAVFADLGLAAFLQDHLDDMAPTAPAESQHGLDLAGQQPWVRLWVGHLDGVLVVTGALAELESGPLNGARQDAARQEELKSMRTLPSARGQGVGRAMLDHLLPADPGLRPVAR